MRIRSSLKIGIRLCLVVMLAGPLTGCASRHQTDGELIANFRAHKAEFEELLEMFRADRGISSFAHGFTLLTNPPEGDIGPPRREIYQKAFSTLHLEGMRDFSEAGGRSEVWFFTSIEGRRQSTLKHYAYVEKPARGIVSDLDQDASKTRPYRHIEGDWYLALDDAD